MTCVGDGRPTPEGSTIAGPDTGCRRKDNMNAVTTKPSNQKRFLREAKDKYPYVWLMDRELPEPKPFWCIIQSDHPVLEFGAAARKTPSRSTTERRSGRGALLRYS